MLRKCRQQIIQHLWEDYRVASSQIKQIEAKLQQKGINSLALDHFAIIDLPGPHTGIPHLKQLFSTIGFIEQGKDYLPDKQNDFLWMTEAESADLPAVAVLPQVVVADFRLDELPLEVKKIIEKYAKFALPAPQLKIQSLVNQLVGGDFSAAHTVCSTLINYFTHRDWPLPTIKEFYTVHAFNELLSWVLVFGRKPNHFTLSAHLLDQFKDLSDFLQFITDEVQLELNTEGGIIKGGETVGIAQSSTKGQIEMINLLDGHINLPIGFVEFVWRYSHHRELYQEKKLIPWQDYFTGFLAHHADQVIESLYIQNK